MGLHISLDFVLGNIEILAKIPWDPRKNYWVRFKSLLHIFIEPFAIQQPAGAVQAGRVTGEVSGATASTHDSGDSTGASSSLKWKHLDPDPVRGMSEYIPVIERFHSRDKICIL